MYSQIIQNGSPDYRRRPGIIICTTSDTLIQHKKDIIPKNGFFFRPGI